jgi:tetratricopeptide (TPR) repeat protein
MEFLLLTLTCCAPPLLDLSRAQLASLPDGEKRAVLGQLIASIEQAWRNAPSHPEDRDEMGRLVQKGLELFGSDMAVLYWYGEERDLAERLAPISERPVRPTAVQLWQDALTGKTILGDEPARRLLSRCHHRLGMQRLADHDARRATEHARAAVTLAPTDLSGYELFVDAALRTGNVFEPIALLAAAAQQHGNEQPDLWSLLFDELIQMGDWSQLAGVLRAQLHRMGSWEDRDHYLARLAEAENRRPAAFIHHFLAMQTGDPDRRTACRSREFVDRLYQLDPAALSGRLEVLLTAYRTSEQRDRAERSLELLRTHRADSDAEQVFVEHVRATAFTVLGRYDRAMESWRRILELRPDYAPASCFVAELLQIGGKEAEADSILGAVCAKHPNNWKVRQMTRLGARLRLHPNGVRVAAVEKAGPLARAGIGAGAVLLTLAGEALEDLAPLERLRHVHSFQGGPVVYRSADGAKLTVEVPLIDTRR